MDHRDHVFLLRKGVARPGGVWADFGSGRGAFTLALAELIGPQGVIHSVDKNRGALAQGAEMMRARFPDVILHTLAADFTQPVNLPPLDGLVIANALHFLRRKEGTVQLLRGYLRPAGRFLIVEYNTDRGNPWVPHPLSYGTWADLAKRVGFDHTELLATVPSSFLGAFFAAASWDIFDEDMPVSSQI